MIKKEEMLFSKKDLSLIIIPLIIEQILMQIAGMMDIITVSVIGEAAVSGVSLVDTINILLINLFSALAAGGAIVVSQYLGSKDKKKSNDSAGQLIVISFIFSVIIMILALIFNKSILSLLFRNVDSAVMANAIVYFNITALSFPFIAIFSSGASIFRAMGNSKISMQIAVLMSFIDIAGNIIFIKMGMGVFGAGLSTTLSRVVAAIIIIVALLNKKSEIFLTKSSINHFNFPIIKRILKIGVPTALENSLFQFGRIILTSLVATLGTAAITAHAVANSLTGVAVIPGIALGLALTTVSARTIGAKKYAQTKYYTNLIIKYAYIFLLISNGLILLLMNPILGFYNLSDITFEIAKNILVIHGVASIVIWPLSFVLPNSLRAANDVNFPMVISILSMLVFRIGVSYILVYVFNFGVEGIWYAMAIDWLFRSIVFTIRWYKGGWQKNIEIKSQEA